MKRRCATLAILALFCFAAVTDAAPVLGNYPNTSSALSADATVTPDVAPTNTAGINVSTSINFKGKLEGHPATGVVRVTNAHPAGSYTVAVKAFDDSGVSVTKTFIMTVTTPATCNPASFAAAINFGGGNGPYAMAVGDFNGDGKQDLAVTNVSSNSVSILLGNGSGSFGAPTSFAVGDDPVSVAAGDFNGDGQQDLAMANIGSNNVSILLGTGTGSFTAAVNITVGNYPYSVAVGDFNGDGKQDLAVADISSSKVSILSGNGTGEFGTTATLDVGTNPYSVVVGDFNGDGKQDLATANNNFPMPGSVSILLRNCALTPTSVVSRKTHGSAGTFDIDLPLTGSLGIECRTASGTNDHTMIVAFSGNIAVTGSPQAQVTMGAGCVGSAGTCDTNGTVTTSGNVVIVPLTNVANAQTINVTLYGINGSGNLVIPMSMLIGDVNGNGAVNSGDVALTKSRIGQLIDATNFRSDVNANGNINATDVSIVKSHVGSGVSLPEERR